MPFTVKLIGKAPNLASTSPRNLLLLISNAFLTFNITFSTFAFVQLRVPLFLSLAFLQVPVILLCFIFFLLLSYWGLLSSFPFLFLNPQCQFFSRLYLWISCHLKHSLWAILSTIAVMTVISIFLTKFSFVYGYVHECVKQYSEICIWMALKMSHIHASFLLLRLAPLWFFPVWEALSQ